MSSSPALSPLCSLFSPTLFQTQTFSLYLWGASEENGSPFTNIYTMQDWRSFAQLSLHLSLALIPTSLVHLSSLYLSAFLHSIFLLSTPPPLPQWVGTPFFNYHGRLSVQGRRGGGGGGRERAWEGGRENWRSVLWSARGGGERVWTALACRQITPDTLSSYKKAWESCIPSR